MIGYIYKYENRINHKVYIGQTTDLVNRKASHKYRSTFEKTKFYNAVRKYGWDNFDYDIIAQMEADTPEEITILLDAAEEKYIEQYDSFYHGYNSTTGGHSCRGIEVSEEFREYCRNRTYSEETRKKMSNAAKNRIVSEETKQKHREAALQNNFTAYREQTKDKRNAAIKAAKSKAVLQIDKEGNIVNEFPSENDAVDFIRTFLAPDKTYWGILNGIHRHCNGKIKKRYYYGFEWKFRANCLT